MKEKNKVVKCIQCNADIPLKSFQLSKAKHKVGKGYICEDCVNKEKKQKHNSWKQFKKFVPYYKPYKGLLFMDLLCAIIATACDLILPVFANKITTNAIEAGHVLLKSVMVFAITLFIMRMVGTFCKFFINKYGHIMGVKMESDLRRNMFKHFQRLPHSFFDESKVGSLMSRITTDLFDITEFSHHCPEMLFVSVVQIVGMFIILFIQQPYMTLCIFLLLPFMGWLTVAFNNKWDENYHINRKNQSEINAQVEDSLSGIRVVKSFANEELEEKKFEKGCQAFVKSKSKTYHYMGLFFAGLKGMDAVMYMVIIILAGVFKIDAGLFVQYLLYATSLISILITFADYSESFEKGITAFARYQEIIDTPVTIDDSPNAVDITTIKGDIKFENVNFAYKSDLPNVLENFNFEVKSGEVVALVGPSGSGKSTVANLIPRFYEVEHGKLTIDGRDVKDISLKSLRKNIGMVFQDVYLFWGTIRENIAFGRIDATEEEIIDAAKKAGAHEFIMALPDGYDSFVGERGVKLSGGQKQRICIARVFLKNPPFIILDEATSSLDNESELLVQKSLDELIVGRTAIVIAHRLSTVRNATKIVVLTKHGIVETGTHQQLIDKDGMYKRLYDLSVRTQVLQQEEAK